jgi:hypothetical protein
MKAARLINEALGIDSLQPVPAYALRITHAHMSPGGLATLVFTDTGKTDPSGVPIWRTPSDPNR